jgi:hypothetical protein
MALGMASMATLTKPSTAVNMFHSLSIFIYLSLKQFKDWLHGPEAGS